MESFMQRALELARLPGAAPAPNPLVGAVLVRDGEIIGEGWHSCYGGPHAEVEAVGSAGDCRGATLYVTLEPCSHHGKTPPCCELLIHAGVSRVVSAMADPNPLVAGRGFAQLREAGIDVVEGVLEQAARELNEPFCKHVVTGLPFIALKLALSLDGKVAASDGSSRWITGPESREGVHHLRHQYQGIMVGIGTVLADDPLLDCRRLDPVHQPVKIILDNHGQLPPSARLLRQGRIVVVTGQNPYPLQQDNLQILTMADPYDLKAVLSGLGALGISGILAEGGGRVASALIGAGLIDKYYLFYAPKLLGGKYGFTGSLDIASIDQAITLRSAGVEQFGEDWLAVYYPGR